MTREFYGDDKAHDTIIRLIRSIKCPPLTSATRRHRTMTIRAFPTGSRSSRLPASIRMDPPNVHHTLFYNITYHTYSCCKHSKDKPNQSRHCHCEKLLHCHEKRHRSFCISTIIHEEHAQNSQPSLACFFNHLSSHATPDDLRAPRKSLHFRHPIHALRNQATTVLIQTAKPMKLRNKQQKHSRKNGKRNKCETRAAMH